MTARSHRSLARVPRPALALLSLLFATQILLHAIAPSAEPRAETIAWPPPAAVLRVGALGEPIGLAQLMLLYLQSFDTQPGVSIPFRDLDYGRLRAWLDRAINLDPAGQYPLLLASQVYSQVLDDRRRRDMLEFVFEKFLQDPSRRWRWLAYASVIAKHELHDLPLALRYAQAIATHANGAGVPAWARQMHIFLLEDMGERQAAKILLGGLLASGTVTDANEIHFLTQRLRELQDDEKSSVMTKP